MQMKRLALALLFTFMAAAGQTTGISIAHAQEPAPYKPEADWYHIQSKVSKLYLDVWNAYTHVGNHLVQARQHPDQVWKFIPAEAPGYFYIQSGISELYLDDLNADKGIGNHIVQAAKHKDQVWKLIPAEAEGYYYIQSKVSGLFLDVLNGDPGVGNHIVQAARHPAQVWKLIPASPPITVRCKTLNEAFSNAYCSLFHVPNPEGWVRGKAALDTSTGQLTMVLSLETDSITQGFKGKMKVALKDSSNNTIHTIDLEKEIPGKVPGKARVEEFPDVRSVPLDIVKRTVALEVIAEHTDSFVNIGGVPLQVVLDGIKVVGALTGQNSANDQKPTTGSTPAGGPKP